MRRIELEERIELEDWTEIKKKKDKEYLKEAYKSEGIDKIDKKINLGLFETNYKTYTSGYNGICHYMDENKNVDYNKVLKVTSRLEKRKKEKSKNEKRKKEKSIYEVMIEQIAKDDEFEKYLFHDDDDIGDDRELFFIDDSKPIIEMKDDFLQVGSLFLTMQYICALKKLCLKPIYQKLDQKESNLVGKVKGKIVFSKNIKENTVKGRNERLYCRYGALSDDNLVNQLLKAALQKAKQNIKEYSKNNPLAFSSINQRISFCDEVLRNVSLIRPNSKDIKNIKMTGAYVHYNQVLPLAKLILANMSTTGEKGDDSKKYRIYPFSINMQLLFECYCRSIIKEMIEEEDPKNCPELLPYGEKDEILDNYDKDLYLQGYLSPDIILKKNGKYSAYDVKYKDYNKWNLGRRNDRLQILAYCYYYGCTKFGLIFPKFDSNKKGNKKEYKIIMDSSDITYCQFVFSTANNKAELEKIIDIGEEENQKDETQKDENNISSSNSNNSKKVICNSDLSSLLNRSGESSNGSQTYEFRLNERIPSDSEKKDIIYNLKEEVRNLVFKEVNNKDENDSFIVGSEYVGRIKSDTNLLIIQPEYDGDTYFMLEKSKDELAKCPEKIIKPEEGIIKRDKTEDCRYYLLKTWFLFEVYARSIISDLISNLTYDMAEKEERADGVKLDGARNPITESNDDIYIKGDLKPDLVLKNNNNDYIVLDAKYKDDSETINARIDRFQLLAYNLIWNCKAIGHVFPGSDFKFEKAKIKNKCKPQGEYCQITIPLNKFSNESYDKLKDDFYEFLKNSNLNSLGDKDGG